MSSEIHPSAVISPKAELADDVVVGPYSIIDGPVRIGAGCRIMGHAHIMGRTTMGQGNTVFPGAVLGAAPQHLGYKGEDTELVIGDRNIFREHFTAHIAWGEGQTTRIGSNNFFMACSHVAHNAVIGNNCTFTNGSAVGGHVVVGDRAVLAGGAMVHQFCQVGRLAMLGGHASCTVDAPPFVICMEVNLVVAVNVRGMRRAELSPAAVAAVKKAFRILFMHALGREQALARIEEELGSVPEVQELMSFVRSSKRGLPAYSTWAQRRGRRVGGAGDGAD